VCIEPCTRMLDRDPSQCAYAYPARSSAWKNSRQFVQTAGPPPNQGNTYRPIIGCTWNSKKALRKMITGKRSPRGRAIAGDTHSSLACDAEATCTNVRTNSRNLVDAHDAISKVPKQVALGMLKSSVVSINRCGSGRTAASLEAVLPREGSRLEATPPSRVCLTVLGAGSRSNASSATKQASMHCNAFKNRSRTSFIQAAFWGNFSSLRRPRRAPPLETTRHSAVLRLHKQHRHLFAD